MQSVGKSVGSSVQVSPRYGGGAPGIPGKWFVVGLWELKRGMVDSIGLSFTTGASPNICTNGDFSSWTAGLPDGWAAWVGSGYDGNITQVANGLRLYSDGDEDNTPAALFLPGVMTIGEEYEITVTIDQVFNPSLEWQRGGTYSVLGSSPGTYSFTITDTGAPISFESPPYDYFDVVLSSVEIRNTKAAYPFFPAFYAQLSDDHKPLYSDDGIIPYDNATILANIAAYPDLNLDELIGNAEKGYAQYVDGTDRTILNKGLRYFGEPQILDNFMYYNISGTPEQVYYNISGTPETVSLEVA